MSAGKAIVVGASSGIGRFLAVELHRSGYAVGLLARREKLLEQLRAQFGERVFVKPCDVARTDEAMGRLRELIREMGGVDLVVLNSGVARLNRELNWEPERETIFTNAVGFAALANVAFRHFEERGRGHLVGISSVAALMGSDDAPAYNASKAFVSNYMAGLRQRATQLRLPIVVTDIQPGYVDTPLAIGEKKFWMATPEKAARQIMGVIRRRASHAYVTRRWKFVAWIVKAMPEPLFRRARRRH